MKVGRAVTVSAESRKLSATAKQLLRRLIAIAIDIVDFTSAPFDAKEVFVGRTRTFHLVIEESVLFSFDFLHLSCELICQLPIFGNVEIFRSFCKSTTFNTFFDVFFDLLLNGSRQLFQSCFSLKWRMK